MKLVKNPLANADFIALDDGTIGKIGTIYYQGDGGKLFRSWLEGLMVDAEKWQHHQLLARERMARHRKTPKCAHGISLNRPCDHCMEEGIHA